MNIKVTSDFYYSVAMNMVSVTLFIDNDFFKVIPSLI